jgi:3-oxoacyl-[acyl-carrier-protein] synthase II
VVITGMGATTALGVGLDAYERGLRSGQCAISTIDLFDASAYRSSVAGQIRGDVRTPAMRRASAASGIHLRRRYGRTALFGLVALAEALADAGLHRDDVQDAGLALGTCTAGTPEAEAAILELPEGEDFWATVAPMRLLTTPVGTTADFLAAAAGVRGPVSTISTACSSATNAIGLGALWIRAGKVSRVLVGGADALCRLTHAGFNCLNLVAPERPLPFDARREGMVIGEGAGMLVLEDERLARARGARIRGRLLGFGNVSEAYHLVQPDPSGAGAERAMAAALRDAGVPPEAVEYINAHGTATPHNDVAEARGIRRLFGSRAPPVSSTKSQTGHLLGASGAVELVAGLLGMDGGFLPPTSGWEEADPEIDIDPVPGVARDASFGLFLSNSFAFGGNDSSLCVAAPDWEGPRA